MTDVERLHDLRRRAKKLRYAIEVLAGALPTGVRTEAHPILSVLQERLGEVNDCAVIRQQLERLRGVMTESQPPTSFDALFREANDLLARSRAELAAWWTPERAEQLRGVLRDPA